MERDSFVAVSELDALAPALDVSVVEVLADEPAEVESAEVEPAEVESAEVEPAETEAPDVAPTDDPT
ncbi:hypothetical protein [Neomicrococcus lactis]|uniref:Uncharacterized protein n=1 Tax=Neomicrococcus lactis TaxID=732241 RepID=A0A7W8YB05_9MICC|nr:hypothetical protein [Neomicrococcus lactis]MBB5598157.1 hypothetical protein [Neomicrococcus lactis]